MDKITDLNEPSVQTSDAIAASTVVAIASNAAAMATNPVTNDGDNKAIPTAHVDGDTSNTADYSVKQDKDTFSASKNNSSTTNSSKIDSVSKGIADTVNKHHNVINQDVDASASPDHGAVVVVKGAVNMCAVGDIVGGVSSPVSEVSGMTSVVDDTIGVSSKIVSEGNGMTAVVGDTTGVSSSTLSEMNGVTAVVGDTTGVSSSTVSEAHGVITHVQDVSSSKSDTKDGTISSVKTAASDVKEDSAANGNYSKSRNMTEDSSTTGGDAITTSTGGKVGRILCQTNDTAGANNKEKNAELSSGTSNGGTTTAFDEIIRGHCRFSQLPPLPKKVVRIFISSTFTDTKEERNALMQQVYPQLSDYCRDKHGLQFQVMDMRWGVPEQASDNHSTTDLCLQEIRKCQHLSVGPNFVALVGNKYGYRPIPSEIGEHTFEELAKSYQSTSGAKDETWTTVTNWYTKDDNAVPPVYILQPISSKIQHYNDMENPSLKKEAQDEWNKINQTLTRTLREAATLAYTRKALDEEEKDQFFISVTENEITEGVINSQHNPSETSYCVIRKIKDIDQQSQHPKIYRFTDLTSDAMPDAEAQSLLKKMEESKIQSRLPQSNLLKINIEWKISGANISVENIKDLKTADVGSDNKKETKPDGEPDKVKGKHAEYLDNICSSFFTNIQKLIDDGMDRQATLYGSEVQEILQHWHLAKTRCEIFEGRDNELQRIKDLVTRTSLRTPIVVHGCSGCGKTSVMSKVVEYIGNGTWLHGDHKAFVMVPRFLGTTPNTSNLHQLLVNICQQLALIFNVDWQEPEKFKELVESFHLLLKKANPEQSIVLLLDSVDQLMPTYNVFKMKWLPDELPEHAKCIISTIDEGYPIIKALEERYGKENGILLNSLGERLGLEIITKWLKSDNRRMTEQQIQVTMRALSKCSLPLYARIAYDQIRRWKSHMIPSASDLEPTVQGAINKLFSSVEAKFGTIPVKHMVSYFTAARQGISEPELEHMLSLDDTFLNHIFQLWNPPIRRVPPLLWTRIRTELHSYIVERSSDDTLVLNWYHRQFIETAKKRYLADADFASYIHDNMVQYFSGKWGGGKAKPFQYTEAQRKRFGFDTLNDTKDRKVPLQPFSLGNTANATPDAMRFNKRKLSELPFHYIKCKDYRRLKFDVFFNYEWLHAKLISSSIQQVLEEFEIFMQADKMLKSDNDMVVLYTNLQLLRPFVHVFPQSLALELTGRLSEFIDQSEFIASLLKGCDSLGANHCAILPVLSCFESANKGFSHHIQFRTTDTWVEGGAICASKDFKTLYILDYTVNGMPLLHVYDLFTGEKVTQIDILKPYEGTTDMYTSLYLSRSEKEIFAFYRQKSEGHVEKKFRDKYALIDVINAETGEVTKTIEGLMLRQEFRNALMYITENFLCVDFMEKVPVVGLRSEFRKDLNKPTFLSENEKLFIVCGRDSTTLKQFSNKCMLGEFDVTNRQMAVGGAQNFSAVIMVQTGTYTVRIYDLSKLLKQHSTTTTNEPQKGIIKSKAVFEVSESNMMKTITDVLTTTANGGGDNADDCAKRKVSISLSPNKDYFMVTYQGQEWLCYMYSLNAATWSIACNGMVCSRMCPSEKYPLFTFDGTKVVYASGKEVVVVASQTCQMVQRFDLSKAVQDLVVSRTSDRIAVMLSKGVLTLKMNSTGNSDKDGTSHKNKSNLSRNDGHGSDVLIRRTVSDAFTQPEIVLAQKDGKVVLEEVKDLYSYADTDRIASARSQKKRALISFVSPNGLRTIQFHRKVQVVDTKVNEIKYTPKKGDVIVRPINKNGSVVNENIAVPGLSEAEWNKAVDFSMNQGDRIVGEHGKVKLRINQEPNGQYRIRNIPSVLTVYSVDDLKLTRLSSVIVYEENVVTIGNEIIVTERDTASGHFVNVYGQTDGNLMATHQLEKPCNGAKLSMDSAQLFVIDTLLTVYLYIGPDYNSLERKISQVSADVVTCIVKDLLCFQEDRNALLILYALKTPDVASQSKYCYVNLQTKNYGVPIAVNSAFDDVSLCGNLAIDSKLIVYDLPTGAVRCHFEYRSVAADGQQGMATDVQLTPKFINRGKLVVFLDRRDETLHLASIESGRVFFSAFYHVPEFGQSSQLYVIKRGILVMKTDSRILCFVLARGLQYEETNEEPYHSEKGRAFTLISNWGKNTSLGDDGRSMYVQRDLLRQNLLEALPAIEKPIQRDFQKQNPERPQVLVVSGSVLPRYFVPNLFSKYLKTEQISVTSSDVALAKLRSLDKQYDAILLQLITDDVILFNAEECVRKVSDAVQLAKDKSRMVLLCLAPCRSDGSEVNAKTLLVNKRLEDKYSSEPAVYLCRNGNLSENGKPITKMFQDGVTLSAAGTKQITINYKDVLLPLLREHYSVGQKKKPKLQSSGNRIL